MRTTPRALALVLVPFVLVLALAAVAPSSAEAQRRPVYVGFGFGGHAFVSDNYRACCDFRPRVQAEIGWHPSGDDSGFFLAGEAILTFDSGFVMFTPGLRLGADIPVYARRDITVFLRPSGLFGGGFWDPDGPHNTLGFFLLQPAFDIRLAVANHLLQIWFRPVAIDLMFFPEWYFPDRDFRFAAAYVFQAGLDFAF